MFGHYPDLSPAERAVALREEAASHRRHANWCLSIERDGWLRCADALEAKAYEIEAELASADDA